MMRVSRHLDPHAEHLVRIWHSGWGLNIHRTPIGVFFRLESGLFFRGGRIFRFWWRPTTAQAVRFAAGQATLQPYPTPVALIDEVAPVHPVYSDAEWEDEAA